MHSRGGLYVTASSNLNLLDEEREQGTLPISFASQPGHGMVRNAKEKSSGYGAGLGNKERPSSPYTPHIFIIQLTVE